MAFGDLIPWRNRTDRPAELADPFARMEQDMHRLLRGFWPMERFSGWPGSEGAFPARFAPTVDVVEKDNEYRVTAELPGMQEDDVDVSISNGVLSLRGEKKEEKRDEGDGGRYYTERSYGEFERNLPLPDDVDEEGADASFRDGVLTITLPKSKEAEKKRKKLEVKSSK